MEVKSLDIYNKTTIEDDMKLQIQEDEAVYKTKGNRDSKLKTVDLRNFNTTMI